MKKAALVLVIIGAVNWLLVGLFQFDLVASIFGGQSAMVSRIIYSVIGLAGLVSIGLLFEPEHEKRHEMHHVEQH